MKNINRIIAVASGKGGVGKSIIASTLATLLSKQGRKVGLLDLDIYGPSSHIILGVKPEGLPEEKNGIIPYQIADMKYMSIVYFTEDKPGAFRGIDTTNIIIELFAITQWKNLDYLIIDMPPGIGDEVLDVLSFIPQIEFLVITTPSKVAFGAVEKLLKILQETDVKLLGVINNMIIKESSYIQEFLDTMKIPYLGTINFDNSIEEAIGDIEILISTSFAQDLKKISKKLSK
jgi:ATP-binding protein involved in chromosome partitioning